MVRNNNVVSMPMRPTGIGKRPIVGDLTKDYVVAGGYSVSQQRVLIGTTDDLEVEVDLRTYDLMENDATITKTKRIIVTGTLSDDLQLAPGATEDEVGDEEYQVYLKIMQFCQRMTDGLDGGITQSLEQLLGNAIKYGYGLAESEWEYRLDGEPTKPPEKDPGTRKTTGMWSRFGIWSGLKDKAPEAKATPDSVLKRPTLSSEQTRLMPTSLKVKPRGATRFVVDNFMNVIGIAPRFKNGTNIAWNAIIDRDKFLVLTMNKADEDPRGRSSYRPAFNWHNIKCQLPSEILRLVLEEIVPKVVAIMAPNAQPFEIERDEDNNVIWEDPETKQIPKMVTASESLKRIIEAFRSGSGAVVPHETIFKPFKDSSTGTEADLIAKIIKVLDDQMENAILLQTLAQSEGEHQARSASQQVAQLLHNLIFWIRRLIAMMLWTDLYEVGVRVNFGEWAIRYLPKVSLGDFVRRDWGDDLEKTADAYYKGFLDDTQRPELMAWLNLPRPGKSRSELGLEANAKPDVNGNPAQPNNQRADKNAGTGRNNNNGTEKKNNAAQTNEYETTRLSIGDALGHHKRGSGFISRHLFSGRK